MDPVDPFTSNPFAILTFIAAPAILINASSILTLGTSNRFARAVDRARELSRLIDGSAAGDDPEIRLRVRQLGFAERRTLLLVRALTAFYFSVGSFAAACLASLLGAIFATLEQLALKNVSLGVALPAGCLGVAGLVCGAGLLVWETRMAHAILNEEVHFVREKLHRREEESRK